MTDTVLQFRPRDPRDTPEVTLVAAVTGYPPARVRCWFRVYDDAALAIAGKP